MKLKELKKGDMFTKKRIEYPNDSQVWIKGIYDRTTKKYICFNFSDVNKTCLVSGAKEVHNDFIF